MLGCVSGFPGQIRRLCRHHCQLYSPGCEYCDSGYDHPDCFGFDLRMVESSSALPGEDLLGQCDCLCGRKNLRQITEVVTESQQKNSWLMEKINQGNPVLVIAEA